MQAADLLKSTDFTMDTIAFESGFPSTSYFFRQFKKHYNCTPKVYRKSELIYIKKSNALMSIAFLFLQLFN